MQSHASDIQMDFAAAHTQFNNIMNISEMRTVLRSICPTDPLMHRWLISQGYPPEGPMYRQPALLRHMTLRIIGSKALVCICAIAVASLAFGECAAIILTINAFTRPVDMDPCNRIIVCIMAFVVMPTFLLLAFRILVSQLSSDGAIEYEVRGLDSAKWGADRLRDVLRIEPNESITSIWVARLLYEALHDRYDVEPWEMASLFGMFGLEKMWLGVKQDDEQRDDAPDQSEPPPRSTTNLYDDWHDDNHWYDHGDPDETWKYE